MATSIDDVIQAMKELANVEKSNFFSSTELFRVANDALRYVYDILVTKWPESYFFSSATFTITSPSNSTTLATIIPSGQPLYKEIGVTKTDGNCNQTILPLAGYPSRNDIAERRFWLAGQNLSFWPQGNAWNHAGTYTLDYVADIATFTTGQNIPAEMERWKELVEVVGAVQLMAKRRKDASDLLTRQQVLEQKIEIAASSRKQEVRKLRTNRDHDQWPARIKRGY